MSQHPEAPLLAPVSVMDESRLSVVMVTHNRAGSVLQALAGLAALPERPQVVVVDNASTDGTADAVAARHPDVRVVSPGRNLGAAGRTVAAGIVDSEYLAFCDDDSGWAPGALTRAAAVLDAHPQLGLLAAKVLVGTALRTDPVCVAMSRSPLVPEIGQPGRPVLGFVACGAVARRSAYLEVGGCHRCYGVGGEERLLAIDLAAAGWQVSYVDDVVAVHTPDPAHARPDRAVIELRDDLWTAWLRLPLAEAVRASVRRIGPRWRAAEGWRALLAAAAGLPWVSRERRPVPRELVDSLRLVGG